ncbi:hypothetical protein B566_EDAN011735 [Ephemera danica]|nr:hypothetical protein B566_EDAN011735 [Ephemera danica]
MKLTVTSVVLFAIVLVVHVASENTPTESSSSEDSAATTPPKVTRNNPRVMTFRVKVPMGEPKPVDNGHRVQKVYSRLQLTLGWPKQQNETKNIDFSESHSDER